MVDRGRVRRPVRAANPDALLRPPPRRGRGPPCRPRAVRTRRAWHLLVMGVIFGVADAVFFPAMNALFRSSFRSAASRGQRPGPATGQLTLIGPVLAGSSWRSSGVARRSPSTPVRSRSRPRPAGDARRSDAAGSRTGTPVGWRPGAVAPAKAGLLADIRAGAAYAAADPAIRTLLLLSAAFNLAINGPIAVGLPWLAATLRRRRVGLRPDDRGLRPRRPRRRARGRLAPPGAAQGTLLLSSRPASACGWPSRHRPAPLVVLASWP